MANDSTEIAIRDGEVVEGLAVRRDPGEVLEEARKAATALQTVISSKKNKVQFNGEQYLEFEDWQTLGRFYGITSKVESTTYVEYGDVHGFEARAVAVRADGAVISAAEAACLTDEEKWGKRTKYEWQNDPSGAKDKDNKPLRVRVAVGEDSVPLFQLKSMAQTRAQAKVLRSVLAWVAVLAGYSTTPAEEMGSVRGVTETTHATPATASTTTNGAAPANKPAVPAGAVVVTSCASSSGSNARGAWTKYALKFSDGKAATTFSDTEGKIAQESKDTGRPVVVTMKEEIKGDRTFYNVTSLKFADEATTSTAAVAETPNFAYHLKDADTEPQGQPERVLIAPIGYPKDAKIDDVKYWEVQTNRRIYLTNKRAFRDLLEGVRTIKGEVTIKFTRTSLGKDRGDLVFNQIDMVDEVPAGGAGVKDGEVVQNETPAFAE